MSKKLKSLSLLTMLLIVFAASLCYGSAAKADLTVTDFHSMKDFDMKNHGGMPGHGAHEHGSKKGDLKVCCENKSDFALNKNSKFTEDGTTKVVASLAATTGISFIKPTSGYQTIDSTSSPPQAEQLSSVVKKE